MSERHLSKRRGPRAAAPMAVTALLFASLVVTACTTPNRNTYTSSDVGQIIETSQGRVLSSRPVRIETDENTGTGALAGGAAGGAVGYAVGSSGDTRLLGLVLGALVGAGAGYLAEQEIRSGPGIEYVVELEDGRVVTLVQNRDQNEQPIATGETVLVQFGSRYTRIIPQSTYGGTPASTTTGGGGSGTWTNPDETGGTTSTSGASGGAGSEPAAGSGASGTTGGSTPDSGGYVRYSDILEEQENSSSNQ